MNTKIREKYIAKPVSLKFFLYKPITIPINAKSINAKQKYPI